MVSKWKFGFPLQVVGFLIGGLAGLLSDLSVFYVVDTFTQRHMLANALAVLCGVCVNFAVARVFFARKDGVLGLAVTLRRFLVVAAVSALVTFWLFEGALALGASDLPTSYLLLVRGGVIGLGAVVRLIILRRWVF